ncbi:hypothetical protein HDU79_011260 [Rhizoclosmatium sp. JEL0117]|nr:hypothetical protein HDU79_011260 [Rhizoclosmatium sp. JEL0117]
MRHVDSEGVKGVWVAESEANLPVAHGRMSQDTVVLFFIHGGGYMLNTCDYGAPHHLLLCKAFNENAKRVNSNKRLIVFSLEYGLAPRHVFPSQVHEAGIAYDWLVTKCGAQHVVVGGDSAGAHCAISLLNHIAETPALAKLAIQPFASVLFSPWINPLMTELPAYRTFDIISLNSVKYGSAVAFGRPTLENVKRINLLENDANDFNLASNGTLIIYGGVEILADVIDEFGKRLQSRKKPANVKVQRFDGMPHDFK